jgi:hypothetical protein
MIFTFLRLGPLVQWKMTGVETLEGTLTAGPGRWRMVLSGAMMEN